MGVAREEGWSRRDKKDGKRKNVGREEATTYENAVVRRWDSTGQGQDTFDGNEVGKRGVNAGLDDPSATRRRSRENGHLEMPVLTRLEKTQAGLVWRHLGA